MRRFRDLPVLKWALLFSLLAWGGVASAQTPTPDQARAALATLTAYVGPAAPTPTPVPTGVSIAALPTIKLLPSVAPIIPWGGKPVRVPVMYELSAPASFSMTWEFGTANGAMAYAPAFYEPASGSFTVRMGQRRGIAGYVNVRVCPDAKTNIRALAIKSRAVVYRGGAITQGNQAEALITCGATPTVADAGDAPAVPSSVLPTRTADHDTDFRALTTTPEGAAGKWATMGSTRWINNEVGKYADPQQDGTSPFQVRDGVFNLVAEKKPTKVGVATLAWSLPMLTTGGPGKRTQANSLLLFQYGWILLDSASPRVKGFVPALWQLAADGRWPPEVDFFEDFDSGGERIGRTLTSHLPGAGNRFGNNVLYGDLGLDVTKRHTHLVHVTPTVTTTWINGVLVDERPTLIHEPSYLLISMAGGMNGASIDAKATEVAWPIYRFAVWRE